MSKQTHEFLPVLESVIAARRATDPEASYTALLLSRGTPYIAQKVGEEAVELAIAAVLGERERTVSEAADLLYHLLVLLADANLSLADVSAELAHRHAQS
ncbi:MAG: phosphoribosyl-ATP diphosphatase [Gammaproteobacteria bacterium]|nr:phosphoribosyl-ATP diphosphatase [Gammaproteobacteria bacterium]